MAAPDIVRPWGTFGHIFTWLDVDLTANFVAGPIPFNSSGYTNASVTIVRNVNPTGGTIVGWRVEGNLRQEAGAETWRDLTTRVAGTTVTFPDATVPTGSVYQVRSGEVATDEAIAVSELRWTWTVTVAPSAGSLHEVSIACYNRFLV